ncbi:hypothetical protein HKBW3S25_02035 [Candidatus Hakubella thermalkaliphila]|uniref:Chaperonin GroEL n=1 Tax=Candidatus Hakubella thermalkaliphila TaxID=2754717 RepID=A0A6V8P3Z3_9ACTN|nr:hypothetical protein HKBW3S25_02035 [Candidatus Hakubella thermalkaliphila]
MVRCVFIAAGEGTLTALQDSASIGAVVVMTEAVVAERPEEKRAPAMPAGGGMGGDMDF